MPETWRDIVKIDNATASRMLKLMLETIEAQQEEIDDLAQMVKDCEEEKARRKPGAALRSSDEK
jgi:uncharacterized protein (UPF0335 family)